MELVQIPRDTLLRGIPVPSDHAKWQAAQDTDMCLSFHQTIAPKSTFGQEMLLVTGGYESAYFLRRRRNNWTRNASAVPTTTSTMVNVLDELEGDGLRFSLR